MEGVVQITDEDALPSGRVRRRGLEIQHENDVAGVIQDPLPAILATRCHNNGQLARS